MTPRQFCVKETFVCHVKKWHDFSRLLWEAAAREDRGSARPADSAARPPRESLQREPRRAAQFAGVFLFEGLAKVTANVLLADVPPPGAGVETTTGKVPLAATSLAGMLARSRLGPLTYVVVRADPFQSTTDEGTKPLPLTVSVNAAAPAVALVGEIVLDRRRRVDRGCDGECLADGRASPGRGSRHRDRGAASRCNVTGRNRRLELGGAHVGRRPRRAVPHTADEETKSEPVTVSVNAPEPAEIEEGCRPLVAGAGDGDGDGCSRARSRDRCSASTHPRRSRPPTSCS